MKPIDVIASFNRKGKLLPVKFQLPSDDTSEKLTVKVDRIQFQEEERIDKNRYLIYRCQSAIDGVERVYDLKFDIVACKWFLYRI